MNIQFSKEKVKMDSKYMEECSTSLATKKCKSK
jgi:hypothetical protein